MVANHIAFRTDASSQIGTGHFMRCLTLADALKQRGAQIRFVSRELPVHLCDMLVEKGIELASLDSNACASPIDDLAHAHWLGTCQEQDAQATLEALSDEFWDWLIVDHYALDARWESMLRQTTKKIMVIDDIANRKHDCDLLLDQNLFPEMESRYTELVPDSCHQLLGPQYALLREEFVRGLKKTQPRDGAVKRVLVFFGGNDLSNVTEKVLRAVLSSELIDLEMDAVVGLDNPHKKLIRELCAEKLPNVNFHCQTKNMAELMARADFAVCAGGTFTWERCCLGLPAIVVTTAENQVALSSFCARLGLCLNLGKADNVSIEKIESALRVFCDSPELLQSFSSKSKKIVDGKGVHRVLGILVPLEISLRHATLGDCDLIYKWRNAEETRRFVFDSKPIPIEIHRQWFHRSLHDPNRLMFVAEADGKAVGVLRYDFVKDEAVVSIYLVPGEHIAGTGTAIIKKGSDWLRQNCPDIKAVRAEVLPQNVASKKAFMAAGYEAYNFVFRYDLTKYLVRNQQEE